MQRIQFTAGQKIHENLYAARLTIPGFNLTIPCNYTEIMTDYDLIPGGKSPKTFIEAITFRSELLPDGDIPAKGILFSLDMGTGDPVLKLQFWNGGLQPGGFIYKFMAVDANYKA